MKRLVIDNEISQLISYEVHESQYAGVAENRGVTARWSPSSHVCTHVWVGNNTKGPGEGVPVYHDCDWTLFLCILCKLTHYNTDYICIH